MDKLNSELGYTLMETLVGIIILGIVITFFAIFFNQTFANPRILLKGDAIILAKQEIDKCINIKAVKDTSYYNKNGNLKIIRSIKGVENLNQAVVVVASDSGRNEILYLSVLY